MMLVNVWTEKWEVGSACGSLSCFWCGASPLGMSPCHPCWDQHCPPRAVAACSAPGALWEQLKEAKLKLGWSLAMVAPVNSPSLVSRRLSPSFPTWNGCWAHLPSRNCSLGLVGPQSWFWGPLCSHSKCEAEHLTLVCIPCPPCAAVAEPWPRGDKRSMFFQLKEPNVFSCQYLVQPNMQCLHFNLEEASGDTAK